MATSSRTLLDRLKRLHPQSIDPSLGRLQRLMIDLDHAEKRLPPVIHVVGTNGNGSLIAFAGLKSQASCRYPVRVLICASLYLAGHVLTLHASTTELAKPLQQHGLERETVSV